ncbi:DUF2637 domain-containing protein [Actinobacteria bacterium YIM 96077]|uniref:Excisionase n=1 Tax=Phytoactinopolyspora halophila TaxID=1981511 RepID=A0A329QMZ8_9ACTN|nr:DUF2637 domain-containing protein [Actinobacteria bacterium YIM 96077]RAW13301.1 excisionase [Phytoactinopolyspora halophila]
MATAVAGTILIALGAFWLSFATLTDLAVRSGIDASRAWTWPLIVDGIIVVATISVVALTPFGPRATRYPWMLLFAGATVSVTGNALHALVARHAEAPGVLPAAVSAVPPLVLLAITHLTVELTRRTHRSTANAQSSSGPPSTCALTPINADTATNAQAERHGQPNGARRRKAHELRRVSGWSNAQIADHLGVHPSTVSRWLNTSAPASHGSAQANTRTAPEGNAARPVSHEHRREDKGN